MIFPGRGNPAFRTGLSISKFNRMLAKKHMISNTAVKILVLAVTTVRNLSFCYKYTVSISHNDLQQYKQSDEKLVTEQTISPHFLHF